MTLLSTVLMMLGGIAAAQAAEPPIPPAFVGTWALVGTVVLHPDGSESPDPDYGAMPKGLMMIDAEGRYSTQIFKPARAAFASGDKLRGTPAEYRAAVEGASTHFGTISVDDRRMRIDFHIEAASFPNWNGQDQPRSYTLRNTTLRYTVPPRPNGDTPVTVWQKEE